MSAHIAGAVVAIVWIEDMLHHSLSKNSAVLINTVLINAAPSNTDMNSIILSNTGLNNIAQSNTGLNNIAQSNTGFWSLLPPN